MLDIKQIMEIIPQRPPILMIDRVEEFEPGKRAVAYKSVSVNEPYLSGHFPGNPIMPGVLTVESMAQTGAVAILSLPENKGKNALFAGIDKLRFKRPIIPGDLVKYEINIIKQKGPIGVGEAVATVNGELAVKGELTFAIIDAV